jgi:hypothetical protein
MPEATDKNSRTPWPLHALVFVALVVIALMCDLKGIDNDEGLRVGIINGGHSYVRDAPPTGPRWSDVLQASRGWAHQPLYFLLQNTVLGVAHSQSEVLLKLVNVVLLGLCLQGLLLMSVSWRTTPRVFLLLTFAFNAFLIMHVLQIREYILGVAFYVWTTWLTLRLDALPLRRLRADFAWFVLYAVLLTLAFYTQLWAVFPAIGQGAFLILRRRERRQRFYTHLAAAYALVLAAKAPYLLQNPQKVDVGLWGESGTALWPQLADGFSLVVTGHLAGHSFFTTCLFWFWTTLVAGAAIALLRRAESAPGGTAPGELRRQGLLMLLCMAVPLGLQLAYWFQRETNHSVWPRYFIVHYVFFTWLLALAFKHLHDLAPVRRGARIAVRAALAIATLSAVYQLRSYHQNPLFDTGQTPQSNWRTVTAELATNLLPGDRLVTADFETRSSVSFTRPLAHPVLIQEELEGFTADSVRRFLYLEPLWDYARRVDMGYRAGLFGFTEVQELKLLTPGGVDVAPNHRLVIFQRPQATAHAPRN